MHCSGCGHRIEEKEGVKYHPCSKCGRFTPSGSKVIVKEIKGGTERMEQPKKVRKSKFDEATIKKILEMGKAGKEPVEIAKVFNGHPNPNAIRRILEKNNIKSK